MSEILQSRILVGSCPSELKKDLHRITFRSIWKNPFKNAIRNIRAAFLSIAFSCCVLSVSHTPSASQSLAESNISQFTANKSLLTTTKLFDAVCRKKDVGDQLVLGQLTFAKLEKMFGFTASESKQGMKMLFVETIASGGLFEKSKIKVGNIILFNNQEGFVELVESSFRRGERLMISLAESSTKPIDLLRLDILDINMASKAQSGKEFVRNSSNAHKISSFGARLLEEGNIDLAESYVRCALDIFSEVSEQRNSGHIIPLGDLAIILIHQNKISEAVETFISVTELYRKDDFLARFLDAYMVRAANAFADRGANREAIKIFTDVLNIRNNNSLTIEPAENATVLTNLGSLLLDINAEEAESYLRRSALILENAKGKNNESTMIAIQSLAVSLDNQGKYVEASQIWKDLLERRRQVDGEQSESYIIGLNNLGTSFRLLKDYESAEALIKRSLALAESSKKQDLDLVSNVMYSLAMVYNDKGDYQSAAKLLERSYIITKQTRGSEHPHTADIMSILGDVNLSNGNVEAAEYNYQHALQIRENSLGNENASTAESLQKLSILFSGRKDFEKAEKLALRALGIFEKTLGTDSPDAGRSLNYLARIFREQGRYADALTIVKRTVASRLAIKSIAMSVLVGSQNAKLIDAKEAFSYSFDVLQFTSSSVAAKAVTKLAQRFAAGTVDLSIIVRSEQDLGVENERIGKALVAASAKAPNERSSPAEAQMRMRLNTIKTEREKIQLILIQQFPDYVALAKPAPMTAVETQKLLDEDEAVVAFDIEEKTGYAWVITKTESFWTEISASSKTLDEQIKKLRLALTNDTGKLTPFNTALSNEIYNAIFGPIADKIVGKKRLSIFANSALTSIPFSLLVNKNPAGKQLKDIDWLIKDYAITIIPSIYSLKTMRAFAGQSNAQEPMIAFADPVFSKAARTSAKISMAALRSMPTLYQGNQINIKALAESLSQLDGTRAEVKAIGIKLNVSPSDIILGLDATEAAVKKANLSNYKIVYFATHGLVAGDLADFTKTKAEPALVMTIPDNPTDFDDGLLQASEIAELKLNADWVVLSACNTATSDSVGAEALSGLARSFLYAGAKSLVASHWDVLDDATAQLMSDLFTMANDNPKLSHGEVLQQAMLKMLASAISDDEAHPRVWAPFVVIGEPAKLH